MQKVAQVHLLDAKRKFDIPYSYLIPKIYSEIDLTGTKVKVPFGTRKKLTEGIVIDVINDSDKNFENINCFALKEIKSLLTPEIRLSANDIEVIGWMKKKYISTIGECTKCFIPSDENFNEKQKSLKTVYLAEEAEKVKEDIKLGKIKNIKHINLLEMLIENGEIFLKDIVILQKISVSVVNTLAKYGYVKFGLKQEERQEKKEQEINLLPHLELTDTQRTTLDALIDLSDKDGFNEALLRGVTGSGKTEVYLQLIDKYMKSGKEAIILVPEISLTPQMERRFKERFGKLVTVIHSGISPREKAKRWLGMVNGRYKICLGPRSAVFAPFHNIGLIIVDEEHEPSYHSEYNPKYNTVEVARQRLLFHGNGLLLLGSATPLVETYSKTENKEIKLFIMNSRVTGSNMPSVFLCDMKKELAEGNKSIFCRTLDEEILKNLEKKEQTILFINRRGHSTFVFCRSCSYSMKCRFCSVSLTYHKGSARLICHYCGYTVQIPDKCPSCGSDYFKQYGTGTQKVEEYVKEKYKNATVLRMDSDTVTYKNSYQDILNKFRYENIDILIGTQMIAKGHDFPNVTLVGILAADSMLNMGDFRAPERAFQLVTQSAGRAGRSVLPGRVVVQSYDMDNYSLNAAIRQDYDRFYKDEIILRKKLHYPPFGNIALFVISNENDKLTYELTLKLKKLLEKNLSYDIVYTISDVARANIVKINGFYRWKVIIKYEENNIVHKILSEIYDFISCDKEYKDCKISLDINPFNMA